jgi:hypothetical protein
MAINLKHWKEVTKAHLPSRNSVTTFEMLVLMLVNGEAMEASAIHGY